MNILSNYKECTLMQERRHKAYTYLAKSELDRWLGVSRPLVVAIDIIHAKEGVSPCAIPCFTNNRPIIFLSQP